MVVSSHDHRDGPGPPTEGEPASGDLAELIHAKIRQRLFSSEPVAMRIDRFVVLEEIGAGGMGTVYAAYDEQLDRKIAIKVLLEDELPTEDDRLRFQREAKALARLSHPNVVAIHEVGVADGKFYLAMEYVEGQNLSTWLSTQPDWRTIIEAFVQAGRGLAAAHAAGLVHRDLKADNLVRRDDGVVKVLDFGLARAMGELTLEPEDDGPFPDPSSSTSGAALSSSLTRASTIVGTPRYMSPEQLSGGELDGRSDQFSFCVTLYKALYGQMPYPGDSMSTLVDSLRRGVVQPPPSGTAVPARVHKVLLRGLSIARDARWPSMEPLLEALSRDPRQRRNRWLLGLVAAGALGGSAALMWSTMRTRATQCDGASEQLEAVWDDSRRADVERAMLATELPYAPTVWAHTRGVLDTYASDGATMSTEACEATKIRGEQSKSMLARRRACLDRTTIELDAVVSTLATTDRRIVDRAHVLTDGLRPMSQCADIEALTNEVAPPLEELDAMKTAWFQLAKARAETRAGRPEAAWAALEAARAGLRSVEHGPIQTEAMLVEALVREVQGNHGAAETALDDALRLASRWQQPKSLADAATALMRVLSTDPERLDEALRNRPLLEGLSSEAPRIEAEFRRALAELFTRHGEHGRATQQHRLVLSLRQRLSGSEHPLVAAAQHDLARSLARGGSKDEALTAYRAALALRERTLGTEHPHAASTRAGLASVLLELGRLEEALPFADRAWQQLQPDLGTPLQRGITAFVLAKIIWDIEGPTRDRDRARRLASTAQQLFATAGDAGKSEVLGVLRWQATRQ